MIGFGIVPDLAGRLGIVPDLAWQIGPHRLDLGRLGIHRPGQDGLDRRRARLHRLGSPAGRSGVRLARSALRRRVTRRSPPAGRDHGRDRPPNPERVEPLLGFDIAIRILAVVRAILAGLILPGLAPTLTPPGHD
ncbi:MAG: hypothetical protein ACTHJW_00815 [Streptosporangiaceae bacterium]